MNILRLDTSGAHTAQRRRWPENVRGVRWPPHGPELNLIERVWSALKDDGAWDQYTDRATQLDDVSYLLQAYDAPTLQALTGYAYVVEAI